MALYTKYGDKGFTFTKISSKTPKNHELVNFLGNLDELNSFIGILNVNVKSAGLEAQHLLINKLMKINFEIGAFIGYGTPLNFEKLNSVIEQLEQAIDFQEKENGVLQNFILPTGTVASCYAHMCRTIARRTERSIYEMEILAESETIIQFLNRISDYFFSLARTLNRIYNIPDIIWQSEG